MLGRVQCVHMTGLETVGHVVTLPVKRAFLLIPGSVALQVLMMGNGQNDLKWTLMKSFLKLNNPTPL